MRRRDFLPLTLLGAPSLLLAGEAIAWSPAVQGLRLGLSMESRRQRAPTLLSAFCCIEATPFGLLLK
jgi:hypothetical protein